MRVDETDFRARGAPTRCRRLWESRPPAGGRGARCRSSTLEDDPVRGGGHVGGSRRDFRWRGPRSRRIRCRTPVAARVLARRTSCTPPRKACHRGYSARDEESEATLEATPECRRAPYEARIRRRAMSGPTDGVSVGEDVTLQRNPESHGRLARLRGRASCSPTVSDGMWRSSTASRTSRPPHV